MKYWNVLTALIVAVVIAAFIIVACEPSKTAPADTGTSIDIDVDRSKPRPHKNPTTPRKAGRR